MSFDKYRERGAYHWRESDPGSPGYEPATEARYAVVGRRIEAGARVIEVGCGDGRMLALAHDRGGRAVGVEPEPAGVALAARMLGPYSKTAVVRALGERLPFPDACFDLALFVDVVEHIPDPGPCLHEMARVLSPGGRLVVTTPRRIPGRPWDARNHVREYGPAELRDLLEGHFEEVTLSFFVSSRWWWLRRRLGKGFVRTWARWIGNPFVREGSDPDPFCHILAECIGPREPARVS